MPKLSKIGNNLALQLSDREAKELELDLEKDYEIVKARKGLYVLMDKRLFEEELVRKVDEKIICLLQNTEIQDRVEEKFEKFLNKIELERFNELLKLGKIEKFKASEKYKKAVYRLKQIEAMEKTAGKETGKESLKESVKSFGKNRGFFVTAKNEQEARELNNKHWKELKEGALKGLKDFDGTYYLISAETLEEKGNRILQALKEKKTATIEEISQKTGINSEVVRGVCAFLKEEGEIMEKRKGVYNYIP